jgi:cytoskeletal protein RodZ
MVACKLLLLSVQLIAKLTGDSNMRNETLLKVIIAVFVIILIILGTFAYGNYARNKQSSQNKQNNQPTVNKPTETPAPAPATSNNTQHQPAAAPASTPAASTPSTPATQPPKAQIPATGAEGAVIPATILAVISYILVKSRRDKLVLSKSVRS